MALVRMCYMHRRQESEPLNTAGAEKKKPDQPVKATPPPPPAENGTSSYEPLPPVVKEPVSKSPTTPVKEPLTTPEKPTSTLETAKGNLLSGQSADIGIPSLKGLGSLRQKAEVQHEEEKKKIPVLTLPPLLDFWKSYMETHSSPSFKQSMMEAILEIKGENIISIRTGHQTGKNRFTAESNLMDGLRALVRIPDLQIVIDIDPDLDKSRDIIKPKKLLSNREKFELLAAKNPLINELRDKLDLIPDQED